MTSTNPRFWDSSGGQKSSGCRGAQIKALAGDRSSGDLRADSTLNFQPRGRPLPLAWGPFLESLQRSVVRSPSDSEPPASLYQDPREDTGPPGNPGSPHLRGLDLVPCAKSQFCHGRHHGYSPRVRTWPSCRDVTLPTTALSELPERFPQRLRRPPSTCHLQSLRVPLSRPRQRWSSSVLLVPAALGPEWWLAAGVTGVSRSRAC